MSFKPIYLEDKNRGINNLDIEKDPNLDSLLYYLDHSAKDHPNNIAIKFNGSNWAYKSVHEHSNKLARLLIENGVGIGDIVGVALDRSPEMIITLLGILKAGAAYLPLDPSYPKDRIDFMLADSGAKMLLTAKKYRGHFKSQVVEFLLEDAWNNFHWYAADRPGVKISGDDVAYVLYTSGSTGRPKGVQVTHRNLVNFLTSMQKKPGITSADKVLAISTISFDIAALELFLPLISGAQIVLATTETAKDGWLLLDMIKNEHITLMQATPYTWRMILAAGWDCCLPVRIISGGEPLPKDLAGKLLPRCSELWNQYGPTETTVYSTQKLITSAADITIGDPIDNTRIYILDENMNKLTDGSAGEIFIGGDGVAKGYLNRPELTAERFMDDLFANEPGAKMYRSGDLGCMMPNGELEFLGRIDNQVKVRGYRIELPEIEHVLLQQDGVREAVVSVWTDGANDSRLAAYIVTTDNWNIVRPEKITLLKQALSDMLPIYMVPDDFVFIDAIPATPNGKADRKALSMPAVFADQFNRVYVAPRTDTEKQLAPVWEQLMGIRKIGVTDNFFELGGHSLVAVQIMAHIETIKGKRLPIATLLEYPTIEELALRLNIEEVASDFKLLVPIKPDGCKTPLYIVHGEGLNVLSFNALAINMDREQPVYGLQAMGLKGETPLEVMEDIAENYVREIVAHNPDGPYYLAGYSFGGYVAVEMRKQLIALKKEVKLIIFDTNAERLEYKSKLNLLSRKLKRHVPRILKLIKTSIVNPPEALKGMPQKVSVREAAPRDSKKYFQRMQKIKDKLKLALQNYSLEPFDDKIYLFRAETCTHYVDDTEFLGWKKYAKQGVEIFEVPGDHLSMLLTPNADEFARILQQGIDKL